MHLGPILSDVSWGHQGFGSVEHHTPHQSSWDWSSPDLSHSNYPLSVPLGKDQGHTIHCSGTTLPALGGISSGAWNRLCGLTAGPSYVSPGPLLLSPGPAGPGRTCALHQTPNTRFFIQERWIIMALLKASPRVVGLPPHGGHMLGC